MKTMRFLSMVALALVGAVMTGCSSDDNSISEPQQPETKSNVVTLTTTVSLDGDAAGTRALTDGGVKTFAKGETMALVYKNMNSEMVKAVSAALTESNITNGGQSATFTFELTAPDKSQDVTYIYPAAMAKDDGSVNYDALASQNGTLATLSSSLDLATYTAAWDGTSLPAAILENQLAILAITLKDEAGANDITSTIKGMTLSAGTNSYTVSRSAVAGPIYIAIRPTSSATITVAATTGTKVYTKSLTGKTYDASNGYSASWRMTEQTGATGGFFSVSDTKKVYFSKGNLRYTSDAWSFFDNQWDYYTGDSDSSWDKFGWSTSTTDYGKNISQDNTDYSGDFVDWGNNSDLQTALGTGWFTLSDAEWQYIFNTRTTTSGVRYAKATVNGKSGVILLPDDWSTSYYSLSSTNTANAAYTTNSIASTDWTNSLEAHGAVFLPAAGNRKGTSVSNAGSRGYYWSSSPRDADNAYYVGFRSDDLDPAASAYRQRNGGGSVRLVRQVE